MVDMVGPTDRTSGARVYARLDRGADRRAPVAANTQVPPAGAPTTVTLDKIGDFLELDFSRLFVWMRNGMLVATVLAATGGVLGFGYAVLTKPRFTVTTDVLIDPANLQVVEGDLYSQPGQIDGQLLIAGSKLRVLTSRNVLARVVEDLDLTQDTEFYDPNPTGFSLPGLTTGESSEPKLAPEVIALRNLTQRVSTLADEKSFVASLLVSAETTDKAIAISDAMIRAFQAELASAEAEGASRAAASLDERLDQLKNDVQQAEERVQAFRRTNNLAASGSGELVSTQTMGALNTQMIEAQARLIAAQANYDAVIADGPNASPAGSNGATAVAALRDRAGSLQQQLTAQEMVYGPRHPTIVRLGAELAAVQSQINTEIERVTATARSTLDEAKANLAAITEKTENLTGSVFADNELQVQLRELERDATSKTAIYESFLSRARQITEQEQIDTTNVRVISTAVPPPGRSWPPRTVLVIGMGAFAGFLLGMMLAVAFGIWRDLRRPPVRTNA
ncbi:MAG TPA: GumC family protein [Devosia sp.]